MTKNYKLIKVFVALFCALTFEGGAQALTGMYTIDGSNTTTYPTGNNFQTFAAFAATINANGVSGPVEVSVVNAVYNEQVTFTQIPGMSLSNRVTINGNGATLTFNGTVGAPHIMLLNGTDNLRVNDLKMIGTNATYATICLLTNSANNNEFNRCSFECPVNGTSTSNCPWSISSSMTSNSTNGIANNNVVNTCTLIGGYYGIFHYGGSANLIDGTQFINTKIWDFYYTAFYGYYNKNITFRGCDFSRPNRTTYTSTSYLFFANYHENLMFEQNVVHDLYNQNQTYSGTLYGMYYVGANALNQSARNTIRNNVFRDIKWSGTTYMFYYNQACNNDYYNNTLSADHNSSAAFYGFYYCYGNGSTYINNWTNNLFSFTGNNSTKYGFYFGGNVLGANINNNNYHCVGSNAYVGYWTSAQQTLGGWKAQSMQDVVSYSIDPQYVNLATGDLHPNNPALNNLASPMGLVFDNIGAVRNQVTPDIGALEFMSPLCAGAPPSNTVTAPAYSICPGEDVALGLAYLDPSLGYTYSWRTSTLTNVGPFNAIPGATSMFYTAPSVTVSTWYSVVITCTAAPNMSIAPVGAVMVAGPTASTVPAHENFEMVGKPNRMPNCSWAASNMGGTNFTSPSSLPGNRVARTGTSYAYFSNTQTGTSYFYSNPITMNTGITYSAAVWYATEYFGYSNWSNLSIMVGPNQSTLGMVQVASVGPAISGPFKLLDGTFTVPTSGTYYVAIRATSSAGSAQYLTIDDLSVTIPCQPGSPNASTVVASSSKDTICSGEQINVTATGADTYSWSTGAQNQSQITDSPMQDATYVVYGMNAVSGCVTTQTVQVAVLTRPTLMVVADHPVVCPNQPVILSVFGAPSVVWNPSGSTNQYLQIKPSTTSSYTVTGVGANGCSTDYVQTVTVHPAATINVPTLPDACKDDVLYLEAFGNGVSYIWYSNSNSTIYQGNPIMFQAPANTIFTVMATTGNNCTGTTTVAQNISDCVGLRENKAGMSTISLYPNPTSGVFTVNMNTEAARNIEIYDVTGRVIISKNTADSTVEVNLSNFSAGVYYLSVKSENSTEVVKVIKD